MGKLRAPLFRLSGIQFLLPVRFPGSTRAGTVRLLGAMTCTSRSSGAIFVLVMISKMAGELAGTSRVDSPITDMFEPVLAMMLTCQGLPSRKGTQFWMGLSVTNRCHEEFGWRHANCSFLLYKASTGCVGFCIVSRLCVAVRISFYCPMCRLYVTIIRVVNGAFRPRCLVFEKCICFSFIFLLILTTVSRNRGAISEFTIKSCELV